MTETISKIAIVIHSSMEIRESKMRVFHALQTGLEFKLAGDIVDIYFDGAGTRTAIQISEPTHQMYEMFKALEGNITSVCRFCAGAMDLVEVAHKAGIQLSNTSSQHLSIRSLIRSDYQVLNF